MFYAGLETGVTLSKHEDYENMLWVNFPKTHRFGEKLYFGNKQQSKDAAQKLYIADMNEDDEKAPSRPVQTFKSTEGTHTADRV